VLVIVRLPWLEAAKPAFLEKGFFIPVSARVLHTTNSYYKSSLLLFFKLSKSKTKKEKID